MYEEAVDYFESIGQEENVLVMHHWDMDGSASAAIVSRILEEVRGTGADFVKIPEGRHHRIGGRAERIIEQEDVSRLIVVDMSVETGRVDELVSSFDVDMLIVDHHDFDGVPENAVFVNPRVRDAEAYVPAAKLCNDVAKEFGLDLDWIAGLGVIQDFAVKQNMGLFERLRKLYPKYFPRELSQHSLAKECRYGNYSSVMNIKPYRDTDTCAVLAFKALTRAQGLKYLESTKGYKELYRYYREMEQEFRRIKEQYDREREVYEDERLIFFEFESDFHINSSIATTISLEKEDWVHIIAKREGERVNVSSRCQSGRVDLGALLRESLPEDAGEDAEAGGHRRAAGASLRYDALDEFKQNLLEGL